MKRGLIIGLIIAAILVIAAYLYMQYRKLLDATWTFAGSKLKSFGFDRLKAEINFDIDNRGDLEVVVSEQEYDVFLNDAFISHASNKEDVTIKAQSVSRMPLLVDIKTQDFIKALGSNWRTILLGDKSNVIIKVKGYFTLKVGLLAVRKLPFEMSLTMKEILQS
jgi:hypothetical protein